MASVPPDPTSSSNCSFSITGMIDSIKNFYNEKAEVMEKNPDEIAKTAAIALAVIIGCIALLALSYNYSGAFTTFTIILSIGAVASLALLVRAIVKYNGWDQSIKDKLGLGEQPAD